MIPMKKVKLEPIWEKIQKIDLTQRKTRDIRINVRKDILVNKFLDGSKKISQIKYNIDMKKEKYKQMKNIKDTQILIVNKTEQKITHLLKGIMNDYNTNYVQYLKFLNKTLEKETQKAYDLNNNIFLLKNNINSLNNKIGKTLENKFKLFKWIELLIKVKEKIKNVPKYYFDILEKNDNYQIYKLKEKISQNSLYFTNDYTLLLNKNNNTNYESKLKEISIDKTKEEKIFNYRYNLIFKSPEEFMLQYSKLENSWLKNLDINNSLVKEIEKLKKNLNEFDEPNFLEDENLLVEKLKLNKNIYNQLKTQYEFLKGQNIKKIKKIKLDNVSEIKQAFSSTDIYNSVYNEMVNNLNFYNIQTFSPNKKQNKQNSASNEFFDALNTNLYKLIFDLFDIAKLSEKYKEIQASFANETKRIKLIKLMKLEEAKRSVKIKTMEEKRKRQFFTSRKIDQSLFKKLKLVKLNKIVHKEIGKQKEEKYEPNIEEFLYDLK